MTEVFCWVNGEQVDQIFTVRVTKKSTVAQLITAIKRTREAKFRNVHVVDLEIYATCYPETIEDQLVNMSFGNEAPLNTETLLSTVYPRHSTKRLCFKIVRKSSPCSSTTGFLLANGNITLNCWVRGQKFDTLFPVEISSTQTVGALKKVIKADNQMEFSSVDARELALYKISFRDKKDRSPSDALTCCTIQDLGESLLPSRSLSTIFTSLHPYDLHIVIEGVLSVECWIRGTSVQDALYVRVSMRRTVDDLKNMIRELGEGLNKLSPTRLAVYKVPTTLDKSDLPEVLNSRTAGTLLPGNSILTDIFNDVPFSQLPRVVIEQLVENIPRASPSTYRHVGDHDPIAGSRTTFLKYATKERLSTTAAPSSIRKRQNDPHRHKSIPCGRPYGYEDPIPPSLLHPVFGQFIHDTETIDVKAKDNQFVLHLAEAMSNIYDTELERVQAIVGAFETYNIHFGVSETKSGYTTDADIQVDGHRYVIVEVKNECGNTSAEPFFQTMGYYLESTRESAPKFPRSPLPCLLLAISGPLMAFAAAAWNLRPTIQLLSSPIAFHFHSTDSRNHFRVARHMLAFRRAIASLKQYYERLQQAPPSLDTLAPSHLFPFPTSYRCGRRRIAFSYVRHLIDEKLVFLGIEAESHDRICIKFAETYSRDAHELLAGHGCAPALRAIERLVDGWYMVVMDMLDQYVTLKDYRKSLPPSVAKDISGKFALLHDAKLVHGDIRNTNIMVSTKNEKKLMVIDFDWAGKIGEARYPRNVNYTDVRRPKGASDGAKILVAHDTFMLAHVDELPFKLKLKN